MQTHYLDWGLCIEIEIEDIVIDSDTNIGLVGISMFIEGKSIEVNQNIDMKLKTFFVFHWLVLIPSIWKNLKDSLWEFETTDFLVRLWQQKQLQLGQSK